SIKIFFRKTATRLPSASSSPDHVEGSASKSKLASVNYSNIENLILGTQVTSVAGISGILRV
ncbi:MAG: hypothetical protein P8Y40_00450, partial [Desulfobacterales bacterium]